MGNQAGRTVVGTCMREEPRASKAWAGLNAAGRRGCWSRPVLLALMLTATACAQANAPAGSPTPTDSPLSLADLKLTVLEAAGGRLAYCDPDEYPIPHGSPLQNAEARLAEIRADTPAFEAILRHENLSTEQRFTAEELIRISDDYKQMQAIELTPAGDGYRFSVLTPQGGSNVGATLLSGTVSRSGSVSIERREPEGWPNCPICLAAGIRIATPNGEIRVQDLRAGMQVWTSDLSGRRVAGVVLETGHMEAPAGHEVLRLALADGRAVTASPGHPTADGRALGDLEAGDSYDGSFVVTVTLIPYRGATWDLLPSGPSGTYFANGVPLGSTLSSVSP